MRKTEVLPKSIVFGRTNKPQQNLSPLPQAIADGRSNNNNETVSKTVSTL